MSTKNTVLKIRELAARPEGVCAADMVGITDPSDRLCKMTADGQLYRGAKLWRGTRYFSDQRAAERNQQEHAKAQPMVKMVPTTKANFAKDAETVITAKTKVTICPPYKPRFEAHTLPFVQTANQAGRVVAEVEL
jgi:hypothetical protein